MRTVLYLTNASNSGSSPKVDAILRAAARHKLTVRFVEKVIDSNISVQKLISLWQARGIVVDCAGVAGIHKRIHVKGIPVVYLDIPAPLRTARKDIVINDASAIGETAARELASVHHPYYAYAGFPAPRTWSEMRKKAFALALSRCGHTLSATAEFNTVTSSSNVQVSLRAWLSKLPRPCAVYAANDRLAEQISYAAQALGLKIPDDIALLGTDNDELRCESSRPPISSIQLDIRQSCELAIAAIARRIRTPNAPTVQWTFGHPTVVQRESTRIIPRRLSRVGKAIKTIREQAPLGLKARTVLASLGQSRRMAEIRFKEATGHSVLNEIIAARMTHAKTLLRETSLSVADVSSLCGYLSVNAFRKMFVRATGRNPCAWRKSR